MSELRTEEEQIEAFKNWWKKNGTSLVVAVSVGVAGYFGWQAWERSQANHLAEASAIYTQMTEAVQDLSDDKNQSTLAFLADKLLTEYDDTGYATFAQLFLAKAKAEKGEYAEAVSVLEAAKASTEDAQLANVIDLRIARLLLEQADLDAALARVDSIQDAAFQSLVQELKGDILLAQGDRDGAREAFQAAVDAQAETASNPLLDVKLKDLVKS